MRHGIHAFLKVLRDAFEVPAGCARD